MSNRLNIFMLSFFRNAKLSPAHAVMVLLIHLSASLVSTLWSVAAETATLQPQELIKCCVTLDMRGSADFF